MNVISNQTYCVTLDATQYVLEALPYYKPHLAPAHDALEGEITHADEERLEITYTIPPHVQPVRDAIASSSLSERLEIARGFSVLLAWQARLTPPEIHPDNLFLMCRQLMIAHRGLEGRIDPKLQDTESFLQKYKALVVFAIHPKYNFDALASGKVNVRNPLCREILATDSIEAVNAILDERIQTHRQKETSTRRSVRKSTYALLRLACIVLTVAVIGAGYWISITAIEALPLQERIIEGQAAFMVNNYGEALRVLRDDNPESLPRSVQYVLAASSIQLENLSLQQRNSVLNHLSPASTENELLYWIRIGRGEFYTALDIALNIGDNQLVLHAYTKLYDMVYADPVMAGEEKQQRLDQYRKQIDELLSLFEGEADE